VWSFALADLAPDSPWGLPAIGADCAKVLEHLAQLEGNTWAEIRSEASGSGHSRNHRVPTAQLSPPAQARLTEIGLDDVEHVFSFRLGGRERLWGIVLPESFACYLLWWDPEHTVYPVARRHT
jgi:uncharacterized protein with von Willebrand factor type A (vWA) domain